MLFKFNEIKSCNCYIFLLNFNLQLLWRLFLITFYQTIFRLRRLPRVFKLLPPRGGQCDQIELFLKDLGSKSALKSSPNIRWLLSLFWKMVLFNLKLLWIVFGQLWENWATLNFKIWSHWRRLPQISGFVCSFHSSSPQPSVWIPNTRLRFFMIDFFYFF